MRWRPPCSAVLLRHASLARRSACCDVQPPPAPLHPHTEGKLRLFPRIRNCSASYHHSSPFIGYRLATLVAIKLKLAKADICDTVRIEKSAPTLAGETTSTPGASFWFHDHTWIVLFKMKDRKIGECSRHLS